MRKTIASIIASIMLAACSTTPLNSTLAERVSPSSSRYAQQKSGTFPLTVTRDSGMRMAACPTEITIDGESAVSLWQGQTVTLFVPAGEYVLGTKLVALCGGGLVETEAIVKPGRQSVFRVGFDFNNTMTISRTTAR